MDVEVIEIDDNTMEMVITPDVNFTSIDDLSSNDEYFDDSNDSSVDEAELLMDTSTDDPLFHLVGHKSPVKKRGLKYHCEYEGCKAMFFRRDQLNRHEFEHSGVKKFKCNEPNCKKEYITLTCLKRHGRAHVIVKCPIKNCPAEFLNEADMIAHFDRIHKKPEFSATCELCSKTFGSVEGLRYHKKTHKDEFKFRCEKCHKGFHNESHLVMHLNSHRDRICPECNQKFETYNLLRKHMVEHKPKEFKCDECGRTFNEKCRLVEHAKLHMPQEERNVFTCPEPDCGKAYFTKRNLTYHTKVKHLKTVAFICQVESCGKEFASKQKLIYHTDVIHENPKPKYPRKRGMKYKGERNHTRTTAKAAALANVEVDFVANKNLLLDMGNSLDVIESVTEELDNAKTGETN